VSKLCPTCLRPIALSKTHQQRKTFHLMCADIGREIGLTPGQVKSAIKQEHFGLDEFKMGNKWYRTVQSSEDTNRPEYGELIETAYRWAAENGVALPEYSRERAA
jgi:hypothetical protein